MKGTKERKGSEENGREGLRKPSKIKKRNKGKEEKQKQGKGREGQGEIMEGIKEREETESKRKN